MRVEKLAGRSASGDFRAEGEVDFSKVRDPLLRLTLASDRTQFGLFQDRAQLGVALALTIEGSVSAAVIRGWDNTLIAGELGCTTTTVKKHMTNIFNKLGLQSRTALVARAAEKNRS